MPLDSVFATLQTALGSAYVNDFNKFGRTYQVRAQADPRFRAKVDDMRLARRHWSFLSWPTTSVGHWETIAFPLELGDIG